MNRTVLIMVVLFTVIFASIMFNLMERSQEMTSQMDAKISKYNVGNLGAYALNWSIGKIQAGDVNESQTMIFDGVQADSFKVLGGQIDTIIFNYDYENSEYQNPVKIHAAVSWIADGKEVCHKSEAILDISEKSLYDLVGHWQMNDSDWDGENKDVIDSTSNIKHGIAVNGAHTTAADAELPWANVGEFDGTNDFVQIDDGVTGLYEDQMSFSTWFKVIHEHPIDIDYGIIATEFNMGEDIEFQPPRWGERGFQYRHGHGGSHGTDYNRYPYRHHYHPTKHPNKVFTPVWSLRTSSWSFLGFFEYIAIQFIVVTETGLEYVYVDHLGFESNVLDWQFITVSYDESGDKPVIKINLPGLGKEASKEIDEVWTGHADENIFTLGGRELYSDNMYGNSLACFNGMMYGSSLYSRALNDDEISTIYTDYQNGITPVASTSNNIEIKIVYWND